MKLYHLRYFVTLAHLEHYTKAAEQLAITQPSLSCAISSLEDELGVKLFEKSGRNITLTKYGRAFLKDVEISLAHLDSSTNNLKIIGHGDGVINFAFVRTLGTNFVPSILQDFTNENTDRDIHFNLCCEAGMSTEIVRGLKEKTYDLALCSRIEKEPTIEFTPITHQELVVIVPYGHPLASRQQLHLSETLPYPQIVFSSKSGLRTIVDSLFEKIGEYPQIAYEVAEDQVIAGLVAHNFGIAVVPKMPFLDLVHVVTLPIISPSRDRLFYLATLKDSYQAPAITNFKKYLLDNASKYTV